MEKEILKELLKMQLQYSMMDTITTEKNEIRTKLPQEDLEEIIQILNDHMIDSIYDSMSIDDHELLWSKNEVEVYEAIGYGYADILGLDGDDFTKLEEMLKEVK